MAARVKSLPVKTPDPEKFRLRRNSLISRLRRVEGQIRGVQAMIEREDDCESIARQLAAARAALDRSFYEMVACSIEQKMGASLTAQTQAAVEEVSRVLAKYG